MRVTLSRLVDHRTYLDGPSIGKEMNQLVIDDDRTIGKSLVPGFSEAGHDCQWAVKGDTGLEKAISQQADVILLDLILPETSGLEILAQIRAAGIQTPVIVLTAKGLVEDRLAGLKLRADDEINSFLDQISKYLQSNRDFIANAAHELRSPLTAIQTSVDVSLTKDRPAQDYRDQLETVSEQLRHLVNQLPQLAETDTTDQRPLDSECDLSELVKQSRWCLTWVYQFGSKVTLNGFAKSSTICLTTH